MNNVIQDYILIEIFNYLENKNILALLMKSGISKDEIQNDEKMKLFFYFLEYKGIIILEENNYKFEENFNRDFSRSGYGKFLVFDGYKDFFNFESKIKRIKDNKKVADGSFLVQRRQYEGFFEGYLLENNIKSFLDVGSGNANLLILLAKNFPDVQFYGVEINENSSKIALDNIKKQGLKNIKIINEDINNIKNIDIENVDLVCGFFVFHELISDNFSNLLKNIAEKLNPKAFVLKEFTPPENLLADNLKTLDQFFISYHMIHELTNQTTFNITQWEKCFSEFGYKLNYVEHSEKFGDNDSLYPLMEFIRNS